VPIEDSAFLEAAARVDLTGKTVIKTGEIGKDTYSRKNLIDHLRRAAHYGIAVVMNFVPRAAEWLCPTPGPENPVAAGEAKRLHLRRTLPDRAANAAGARIGLGTDSTATVGWDTHQELPAGKGTGSRGNAGRVDFPIIELGREGRSVSARSLKAAINWRLISAQ